jgi:hypothetical protein
MRERRAEPGAEAARLARRLAALEEGPMRTGAAARAIGAMPPGLAAEVLSALALAPGGEPAISAVGRALVEPGAIAYGKTAAIYAAARERGLTEVQALLFAPPAREGREEPPDRPDPVLEGMTLGHRKALARATRDPDVLARVAADGDPAVVRELLRNPKLTEPLVVRIAARRPCRPASLRCVWEDRRWRVRPAVKTALAKNPFLEPALATKLLPSLDVAALREIEQDREIAAAVRALARRLGVVRGG